MSHTPTERAALVREHLEKFTLGVFFFFDNRAMVSATNGRSAAVNQAAQALRSGDIPGAIQHLERASALAAQPLDPADTIAQPGAHIAEVLKQRGHILQAVRVALAMLEHIAPDLDGCGACGDACQHRGGECRLLAESPPLSSAPTAGADRRPGERT